MFVITLTYKVPLEVVDQHRPAHIEWLKGLFADGLLVVSGRQNPAVGGVLIAKGARDVVEAAIKGDPYNINGLADYVVTEFVASMAAPGLESLKD
jgi:uncharacterized protein YciI